ncbi:MAG: restriction endonuclease [Chromatiaceae bacterium]|nr:restriction endonuclease [Chromatiaceae bacterium]
MAIASFDRFIEPLLRLLILHPGGIKASDAQRALADQFGITDEERRVLLPSGIYPVYKSRIGWANDRLKRQGFSISERRGYWRVTEKGLAYAASNPSISEGELKRLAYPGRNLHINRMVVETLTEIEQPEFPGSAPEERIHQALTEIREGVVHDLLQRIASREPEFFERLVLQVLKAMGYGADELALEHSGSPGDDGIDGIISLDRLGLDQVYVQAKRYAEDRRIQKDAIHGFIGALHLKGANKGVFITTSGFSAGATKAAQDVRGLTLRLIDGDRLARLMIEHQVGVQHDAIPVPKLDLDFWEDA